MKAARIISIMAIAFLLFSVWPVSAVSAHPAEGSLAIGPVAPNQSVAPVAIRVVPLWIKNRTGGVLFVTLEGPKTYYFTVPDEKTKFLIVPGRYRVRAISTGCSGTFEHQKNFKQGGNLVYYCDSQ